MWTLPFFPPTYSSHSLLPLTEGCHNPPKTCESFLHLLSLASHTQYITECADTLPKTLSQIHPLLLSPLLTTLVQATAGLSRHHWLLSNWASLPLLPSPYHSPHSSHSDLLKAQVRSPKHSSMDLTECKLKFKMLDMIPRLLPDLAFAYFSHLISWHFPLGHYSLCSSHQSLALCWLKAAPPVGKGLSRTLFLVISYLCLRSSLLWLPQTGLPCLPM